MVEGTAGGIVGVALDSFIYRCSNEGKITVIDNNISPDYGYAIGGVAGYSKNILSACINSGDVSLTCCTLNAAAGGICGHLDGTSMKCVNSAKVECIHTKENTNDVSTVGGIIGHCLGHITYCFSVGKVTLTGDDNSLRHGIIAGFLLGGTVDNCYGLKTPGEYLYGSSTEFDSGPEIKNETDDKEHLLSSVNDVNNKILGMCEDTFILKNDKIELKTN